jgi:hypothetical protein
MNQKQQTAIDVINAELEKDTLSKYGRDLLIEFKKAVESGKVQKMIRLEHEMKKAKANLIFYKDCESNKKEIIVWSDFSDKRLDEIEKIEPCAKELIATLIEMKESGSTDTLKFNSIKKELEKIEKENGSLLKVQ